ncbi:MAG: C4-dicarboxylate transporter DcuC [Bacteroidales bacterium]|nr:C4-dicarboxylate transporter DcuC [Bacteroidales bacterium]
MLLLGAIISLFFITVAARWLVQKHNPQAVLLVTGLMMLSLSLILGINSDLARVSTGSVLFDLFRSVAETFTGVLSRFGFMIMAIGGYVGYMNHIKASDALVYVSMKPLSLFKKYPYIAAIAVIPLGALLSICIPSASGLGLLLVVSVFPVLISLGVSRLTAVSVIAACTAFDVGPGFGNAVLASELAEISAVSYFVGHQLPLVIPMTILLVVIYYFSSRYYDKRDIEKGKSTFVTTSTSSQAAAKIDAPLIYAVLPMLPVVLLIVFSDLFNTGITLDTTTAMLFSFVVALLFELVRNRNLTLFFTGIKYFWEGMGNLFMKVVTLIVCAEIFASGLIGLGFIEALVAGSMHLSLSGAAVGMLIAVIVFLAGVLMGSGNAAFFSFGPLVPNIAKQFGLSTSDMITPIQMSASMGRTVSPISGVVVAISEIAGVSPFDLAKRNAIPFAIALVFMLAYNFVILG